MAGPDRDSGKPSKGLTAKATTDPVLRNALRYTISAKEYEVLHKYIISRSNVLERNAPSVSRVENLVDRPGRDDFNAAAVRASLRVFILTSASLKAWAVIKQALLKGPKDKRTTLWKSPTLRLSLSLSSILLLHRLLFRFFSRLRAHLLTPDAQPFRRRNPRTSRTLTSRFAPAVGASLAGFMLGVYPAEQLRLTIAIYILSQAAEVAYNLAEEQGWIWGKKGSRWERPWWFGSWMLMPLSAGQLLHAFVFDRDCFPHAMGNLILKFSPQYIQERPLDYPSHLPWPAPGEIVENLATIAHLKNPPFVSPIMFPPPRPTLPASLSAIAPITSPAHPLITSLTCATLHPSDPSCLRTQLTYWLRVFPRFARFFAIVFAIFAIPKWRTFYTMPVTSLDNFGRSVLRMATLFSGSIGTAWGMVCLFQNILSKTMLPTQRFFIGGFISGFWGFLQQGRSRGHFLYMTRMSLDSLWKVGVKRGWWKGVKGGDVWLFVAALAVINAVYTKDSGAIKGGAVRRVVAGLRGETMALSSGTRLSKNEEKDE